MTTTSSAASMTSWVLFNSFFSRCLRQKNKRTTHVESRAATSTNLKYFISRILSAPPPNRTILKNPKWNHNSLHQIPRTTSREPNRVGINLLTKQPGKSKGTNWTREVSRQCISLMNNGMRWIDWLHYIKQNAGIHISYRTVPAGVYRTWHKYEHVSGVSQ